MCCRSAMRAVVFMLVMSVWMMSSSAASSVVAVAPHFSDTVSIARLRAQATRDGLVPVIVRLNTPFRVEAALPASETHNQRAAIAQTQDHILRELASISSRTIRRFRYVPLLALDVDAATLQRLAVLPEVADVQEDAVMAPALTHSTPLIGATTAWHSGFTGAGQTIAVIDTGVDTSHPMLAGKIVDEACFVEFAACPNGQASQVGPGAAAPCTIITAICYHGTHDAGIAAGRSARLSGVAPDATIIAIQVFQREDSPSLCSFVNEGLVPCVGFHNSSLIAALEHVYELRNTYHIAAVNMSLGSSPYDGGGRNNSHCDNEPAKPIIDMLRAAGIASVASAGNNGYADSIWSPACISSAISVGATDLADQVASFSNNGIFLDLFAPGVNIYSSFSGGGY